MVDVVLHLLPRPAALALAGGVQWGVAIEIERAINLTRARELHYRVCAHGALENPSSLYGFKVKSSTGHGAARAAGMAAGVF